MLRNIKLYGHLGKRFGKLHRMDVKTPAEAIAALRANFADFNREIMRKGTPGYHVLVGNRDLNGEQLADPCGQGDIKIIPAVQGAKKGGVFQTILGVALVVIGAYTNNPALIGSGVSMIAGGVVQMLTRTPGRSNNEKPQNAPSYSFNGPVNTTTQGNPVPICYGEMIVGSQVASFGLNIENMYVGNPMGDIPTFPDGTPRGDGLPSDGTGQMTITRIEIQGSPRGWERGEDYRMLLGVDDSYRLNHNWNYSLRQNYVSTEVITDVPYDGYERCFYVDLNEHPSYLQLQVGQQIWILRGSDGGVPVWGAPGKGDEVWDSPITQQ